MAAPEGTTLYRLLYVKTGALKVNITWDDPHKMLDTTDTYAADDTDGARQATEVFVFHEDVVHGTVPMTAVIVGSTAPKLNPKMVSDDPPENTML